jgi:hypothetical protein
MGGSRSIHGGLRNIYKFVNGKPEERDYSEDLGVDGEMVLECSIKGGEFD